MEEEGGGGSEEGEDVGCCVTGGENVIFGTKKREDVCIYCVQIQRGRRPGSRWSKLQPLGGYCHYVHCWNPYAMYTRMYKSKISLPSSIPYPDQPSTSTSPSIIQHSSTVPSRNGRRTIQIFFLKDFRYLYPLYLYVRGCNIQKRNMGHPTALFGFIIPSLCFFSLQMYLNSSKSQEKRIRRNKPQHLR